MPTLNRSIQRLFNLPPQLSEREKGLLVTWLKRVERGDVRKIYASQFEMVKELVAAEQDIQRLTAERASLLGPIPDLKAKGDIEGIRSAQRSSSDLDVAIRRLKQYRDSIKFVGDTIAQRMVDIDLIKQFALVQSTGYVSGKEGLYDELKAADQFAERGYFVLINDLTHCLKAGDLTLRKDGKVFFHEVKKNPAAYKDRHTKEQILRPALAKSYVEGDVMPVQPQGHPLGIAVRLDHPVIEDFQTRIGGELLKPLRRGAVRILQKGAVYHLAAHIVDVALLRQALEDLTTEGDWVVGRLSDRVSGFSDIPPFSDWLKPEASVDVASGELVIFSALSLDGYRSQMMEQGVDVTWKGTQSDYPDITYAPLREPHTTNMAGLQVLAFIQQWRWERVLYGFYSLVSYGDLVLLGFSPDQFAQAEAKIRAFEEQGKTVTLKTLALKPVLRAKPGTDQDE